MTDEWRYRGRTIYAEDVIFIRELIAQHPHLSRRKRATWGILKARKEDLHTEQIAKGFLAWDETPLTGFATTIFPAGSLSTGIDTLAKHGRSLASGGVAVEV